jgi:hypothetical protein
MKLKVIKLLLLMGISLSAEPDVIPKEKIKTIDFAPLDYPIVARIRHEQGMDGEFATSCCDWSLVQASTVPLPPVGSKI